MIKKTFLSLLCVLLVVPLSAQSSDTTTVADASTVVKKENVRKWKYAVKPGMKMSRSSFSNWLGGGKGNNAIMFESMLKANYKDAEKEWNNTLLMDFGFNKREGENSQKVIDKIDLTSHYSIVGPNEKIRYSAMFNLKSQFADGYDYRSNTQWYIQSSFFAPGYITANVGFDYIGIKHLNIHVAPFTEKTTIVRDAYYDKKVVNVYYDGYEPDFDTDPEYEQWDEGPSDEQKEAIEQRLDSTVTSYGLAWRENSRFELGAGVQLTYDNPDLMKNIGLKSELDVFAGYASFLQPDIDWEVWLTFKFNKFLSFNINTQLIYDKDIMFQEDITNSDGSKGVVNKAKVQFRDLWGVGVTYTFNK